MFYFIGLSMNRYVGLSPDDVQSLQMCAFESGSSVDKIYNCDVQGRYIYFVERAVDSGHGLNMYEMEVFGTEMETTLNTTETCKFNSIKNLAICVA